MVCACAGCEYHFPSAAETAMAERDVRSVADAYGIRPPVGKRNIFKNNPRSILKFYPIVIEVHPGLRGAAIDHYFVIFSGNGYRFFSQAANSGNADDFFVNSLHQ